MVIEIFTFTYFLYILKYEYFLRMDMVDHESGTYNFTVIWEAGTYNLADFFTKAHPVSHHVYIMNTYLVPEEGVLIS